MPNFLHELGLDGTADERAVRRAYARQLKQIDPEADPSAFQALRANYEAALDWVRQSKPPSATTGIQGTVAALDRLPATESAPSYAPSKVVPRLRTKEPSLAAPTPKNDALTGASTAFDRFVDTLLSRAASSRSPLDPSVLRTHLEQTLASDDLTSLSAREAFEYKVASLLTRGWQPGHEVLFDTAAEVFRWDTDRKHLQTLGHVGSLLERALNERTLFDGQHQIDRMQQRTLIARLRAPTEPRPEDRRSAVEILNKVNTNFPTWLGIVTDVRRLQQWRELHTALPAGRPELQEVHRQMPAKASTGSSASWLVAPPLAVLFIALLHGLGNQPAPSPTAPPEQETTRLNAPPAPEPREAAALAKLPRPASTAPSAPSAAASSATIDKSHDESQ